MIGMKDVGIRDQNIDLDQFLKLSGAIGSGGEAKVLIQAGHVKVNGQVETRRRKSIALGDVVTIDGAPEPWCVTPREMP
jgi:ribosome-associated protein